MKVLSLLLAYQLTALPALPLSPSDGDTGDKQKKEVWTAVCGGSPPDLNNASNVLPPPVKKPLPVNESLVLILLMSRTAGRICDELNNTLVLEMEKTQSEIKEFGVSPLENLITGKYEPRTEKKGLKEFIGNEITRLSRIGVFLELARNDTVEYVSLIAELERKIMEILCLMYKLLNSKAEVKSNISRDIVTSEFKDLSDLERHKRNFFITRASRNVFVNLIERLQVLTKMTLKDKLRKRM